MNSWRCATTPKRLLLHTCCAGCASEFLRALEKAKSEFDITLYFSNSNIHPRTEWQARLHAVQALAQRLGLRLIVADWSPKRWYKAIDTNPDNSGLRRCTNCWNMRIQETANYALHQGYTTFSTTLLASHHQDREKIENLGKKHSDEGLEFVIIEPFRLTDNYRSTDKLEFPTAHDLYQQNYCGCVYSLRDRYEEKFNERCKSSILNLKP